MRRKMVKSNQVDHANSRYKRRSFNQNEKNKKEYKFMGPRSRHNILFANERELYVVNGNEIHVYNPIGGNLLEILKGHEHEIICLIKGQDQKEDYIISCDEQANIFNWYSNKKNPKHGSTMPLSFVKGEKTVTHFSMGKEKFVLSFILNEEKLATLGLIRPKSSQFKEVIRNVLPGQNKVAVSPCSEYIAAIREEDLFIYNMDFRRHHLTGTHQLKCVAFHPTKIILATGNENGAIFLWYNILKRYPVKSSLHWHTMPVRGLSFSSTGSDLYSGGEECVMVRWRLTDDNRKSFLPRMGMPVHQVQTDQLDSFVALLHSDSSISIINSKEMQLEGLIKNVTRHVLCDSRSSLSAGIHFHEPTGSIIKNGRIGHLLFFHPHFLTATTNLDITMGNFVTEERNKKLPNPDVTLATLSENGLWLITIEVVNLTVNMKEIVMKFWYFSLEDRRWELNTSIRMPHADTVNCISISPAQESEDLPMCSTCSEDGYFKIFKLITYQDILGKTRSHWNSRASRNFRGLPATACNFASDGSLLAVAFKNIVTLWTPEDSSLAGSLSQPFISERILDVTFSYGDWEGSALVTRSENWICSWNLLSCTLLWRIYLISTCLTVDRTSGLIAVFSKRNNVFFFEPVSCSILSTSRNLSSSNIICATFGPNVENSKGKVAIKNQNKRIVYFFNEQQKFLSTEAPPLSSETLNHGQNIPEAIVNDHSPLVDGREELQASTTSELYSALVAKTRSEKKEKPGNEDDVEVNLIAPSVKNLMKDLHDFRIHTLSITGLVSHLSSFTPDLSLRKDLKLDRKSPKYITVEEETGSDDVTEESYSHEDFALINNVQNIDYKRMLSALKS